MKNKIVETFKNPFKIFGFILRKVSPLIKDDTLYIKLDYFFNCKKLLHLTHPKRYNEKLQWLKLHYKKDIYTKLVDKYEVKGIVASKIGNKHIIPTLGVWDRFEDIDFDELPERFVLKCTHDSGGLVICKDKKGLDYNQTKKKINKSLKRQYFLEHREYPYKNVKPRIIAEQYMVDESGFELKDYKIFCFNGIPRFIEVDFNRFKGHKRNIYSTSWELLPFEIQDPSNPAILHERPICLDEMLSIASNLSSGFPHVRVDLYVVNGQIYFGELTFFHGAGMEKFKPDTWDYKLGEWLQLPEE